MKLFVTGATGYIGERLLSYALSQGFSVVAAARSIVTRHSEIQWTSFDLSDCNSIDIPMDVDAVVHLAANTSTASVEDEESEVRAAKSLIKASKIIAAKFIFVSSQTAAEDAPTSYGRIKWKIEKEVLSVGGWVVRPGQVYGGAEHGLFGTLVTAVRKMPLLPAFMPVVKVQPIHVDDLVLGLLRVVEQKNISPCVLSLAAVHPVSFTSFLAAIAKYRLNIPRLFIPFPIVTVNFMALVVGSKLRERLGLERLRSLFSLPVMKTSTYLEKLGLRLRSLEEGMLTTRGRGNRRRLLCEAHTLFVYIMKEYPSGGLARRYVRSIEQLREGKALNLPPLFSRCPWLLALIDDNSLKRKKIAVEFLWRLDAATALAEASPRGAYIFLGLGRGSSFFDSLRWMFVSVSKELLWKILRLVAKPVLRRFLTSWSQSK